MAVKDNDTKGTIRCSLCGKTQDEVGRLIEGPGVYICDGCISFCINARICCAASASGISSR